MGQIYCSSMITAQAAGEKERIDQITRQRWPLTVLPLSSAPLRALSVAALLSIFGSASFSAFPIRAGFGASAPLPLASKKGWGKAVACLIAFKSAFLIFSEDV